MSGRQVATRWRRKSGGGSTLESMKAIHGKAAARQPFTMLLSLGLMLMGSSPINNRAGTSGCLAIAARTSGMIGSSVLATQKSSSKAG